MHNKNRIGLCGCTLVQRWTEIQPFLFFLKRFQKIYGMTSKKCLIPCWVEMSQGIVHVNAQFAYAR